MQQRRSLRRLIVLCLVAAPGCAAPTSTVYVGPTFLTGDPDRPEVRAIAVDARGRIVSLHDAVPTGKPLRRLEGVLAVPGLHDAHLHAVGIGRATERAQLGGANSAREVVARIRAHGSQGAVIFGRGWDQTRFPGEAFPTAEQLAPLGDQRPVVLTRVDGHAIWVNRRALGLAGIDAATRDPPGGQIIRDAAGRPTGVLVDNAMGLVTKTLPAPNAKTRLRWFLAGLERCHADGLTAVHDMGIKVDLLGALVAAVEAGRRLPVRLFVYLDGHEDASYALLRRLGPGPRELAPRVWVMGTKIYADGAMGSRGAALLEAYSDAPGQRGHLLLTPAELTRRVTDTHALGYQAAVHAIGDRGVRAALDAIQAAVQSSGPRRGPPHRVEHAQLVHQDDLARFRALGVVASMQPTHATSDMRWALKRVGASRIGGAYAWRKMLQAGITLAFGSDAPIESHEPGWGLYAAVTRQDHQGAPAGGWRAEEKLDLAAALAAFSRGAADAVGRPDLGRLVVGAPLDLTVFEVDLRSAPPRSWLASPSRALVAAGRR